MDLQETLEELTKSIHSYRETPFDELHQIAEIMKDIAILLYDLTRHKVKYKKNWNQVCFENRDMSVAAAEREANIKVPELDLIRQVMRAGNNALDTIRSHVSLLKAEK